MYDVHIYWRIRGFTVSEPTQQSVKCPNLKFVAPQTGTPKKQHKIQLPKQNKRVRDFTVLEPMQQIVSCPKL